MSATQRPDLCLILTRRERAELAKALTDSLLQPGEKATLLVEAPVLSQTLYLSVAGGSYISAELTSSSTWPLVEVPG